MVRLVLGENGGGGGFGTFSPSEFADSYVKLVIVPAEADIAALPRPLTLDSFSELAQEQRPTVRTYTVRDVDEECGEITIDFVVHGDQGVAGPWASAAVVVEAGLRSGAASTASWAKLLGRPVGAVPGPVTSAAGCHALLRDEAVLVRRATDVVELAGRIGELTLEPDRPVGPLDQLSVGEKRVYDALPSRGGCTVDEVAVSAGMPAHEILGPLAMLEIAGLVVGEAGCRRRRRRR